MSPTNEYTNTVIRTDDNMLKGVYIKSLKKHLDDNPPPFRYEMMYFYYIIHTIAMQKVRLKDQDYVNLNQKKLEEITVSNIGRYIKILKNGGFIFTDNVFIQGKKSIMILF